MKYGNKFMKQEGSKVTVVFHNDNKDSAELEITVRDQLDNVLELITAGPGSHQFVGLVPVATLGKSFAQHLGHRDSPRWLLAIDMISYGCLALVKRLRSEKIECALPDDITVNATATYPLESELCETMVQFLGLASANTLKKQPPILSEHLQALRQFEVALADLNGLDQFLDDITLVANKCIAIIFVLSLFAPTARSVSLFVVYDSSVCSALYDFHRAGFLEEDLWSFLKDNIDIIIDDRPGALAREGPGLHFDSSPVDLFHSALRLLGHNVISLSAENQRISQDLAMSSFCGQTAFPDILLSLELAAWNSCTAALHAWRHSVERGKIQ